MRAADNHRDQAVPGTDHANTAAAAGDVAKQRYSAPDLHVVGKTEKLVQGCGPHSGFDYRYYQTYCLE
ncbi:MAG TPA: hypothetical protein VJ890_20925 [Vineibacter sp.]|nr:hypothetical protein [Vineibacter sp.]